MTAAGSLASSDSRARDARPDGAEGLAGGLPGRLAGTLRPLFSAAPWTGILPVADQAVVSGANFATVVLLARSGTPADLGRYSLALAVVVLLRGVQEQLIGAPFLVYCHRYKRQARRCYAGSSLAHHLLLGAASAAALLGVWLAWRSWGNDAALGGVLGAVAAVIPFLLLREYVRHLAFAELRLGEVLLADTAVAAVQVAGMACLAGTGRLTIPAAYLVLGVASALMGIGWLARRRRAFRFHRRQMVPHFRANWRLGRWALASMFVGNASGYLLPWVLAAVHGQAATGRYHASLTLINIANMVVIGLSNVLTPRAAAAAAHGGTAALCGVLRRAVGCMVLWLVPFALVMYLLGERLAHLVYGWRDAQAAWLLTLLSLGLLANALGIVAGNGLWALDRPAANFRADVTGLVVLVGAAWWAIAVLGVPGAALAVLASALAAASVRWTALYMRIRHA